MEELLPSSLGKSKPFPMLWVTSWERWGSWGPCGVDTSQGGAGDGGVAREVDIPSSFSKPGLLGLGSGTENFTRWGAGGGNFKN